jgi:hypothetical protein
MSMLMSPKRRKCLLAAAFGNVEVKQTSRCPGSGGGVV